MYAASSLRSSSQRAASLDSIEEYDNYNIYEDDDPPIPPPPPGHKQPSSVATATLNVEAWLPTKEKMQKVSSAVSDQLQKSRHGVQQVKQAVIETGHHVSNVDSESIWRQSTPFALLLGWLLIGMVAFYIVESPAEAYRIQLKNAQKSANGYKTDPPPQFSLFAAEFPDVIEEHTVMLDMSLNKRQPMLNLENNSSNVSNTSNASNASNSSLPITNGTNSYTSTVPSEELSFYQTDVDARSFNRMFFYGSDQIEVVSVKMSQTARPSNSGNFLALTVFYINKSNHQNIDSIFLAKEDDYFHDSGNKSSHNLKWDLPGSLFFCLAVVTTIGYGNLAPATYFGKFICVLYAVIGIPLFMLVVEQMRTVLTLSATKVHKVFFLCAQGIRRQSAHIIAKSSTFVPRMSGQHSPANRTESSLERRRQSIKEQYRKREVRAATGVVAISCCLLFIFLPSIFFAHVEGWDYLGALYYAFISLTTIGFGDLIAGQRSGDTSSFFYSLYRLFLCVWLFFGIAFLATLIHIMQILIERLIERIHWKRQQAAQNRAMAKRQVTGDEQVANEGINNIQNGKAMPAPNTVNLLDIINNDVLKDSRK